MDPREPELLPHAFDEFCADVVLGVLTHLEVPHDQATVVSADLAVRGHAYALLTGPERRTIAAPAYEETRDYQPAAAPAWLRAHVGAVVRNSAVEHVHAHGPLESGGITWLTETAAGPLSHLLAAADRNLLGPPALEAVALAERWRSAAAEFPRAWAALAALADVVAVGGRANWRVPADITAPDLPEATLATVHSTDGHVVLDAMTPEFDEDTVRLLADLASRPGTPLFVPTLSRLSRELTKLLQMLEVLLAAESPVVTTNYLLRPGEAFARHTAVLVSTRSPTPPGDLTGLTGTHRKVYATLHTALT